MKKVTQKIFYAALLRFQILFFVVAILPLATIKILLIFQPSRLGGVMDILLIASIGLSIIGGCFYALSSYASFNKTLKPITQMAEVGELSARVAHDLRGPLSGIRAALIFFQELKSKDPQGASHLNLLELSTRRLEKVAQDLLKKHRGEEELSAVFCLHEVLDELIGEYASQPGLSRIRFQKRYFTQPILIFGKRNKIERMFGNIVKNAVEAINLEGGVTIQTKHDRQAISVLIQDTGPGLSPKQVEKIMAGSFTEGKKDGHGLGLTFVKEVLADHRGSLNIFSDSGKGAGFEITLPAAQIKSEPFSLEMKGPAVLIVDDDPSVLEQWNLCLTQKGCKALLAESFEDFEAKKISAKECQTAVVDYHFDNSEWNGLQIIEELRKRGWQSLTLCTAEYWKPSLKKQAEGMGVAICPKPLPEIKLRKVGEETANSKGYHVLVVDDDKTIRLAWEVIQDRLHIEKLYLFPNLESLLESGLDLASIDIAFVDKNITNSRHDGSEVVSYLKSRGVAKVVLASGESEKQLREDPAFAQADFIVGEKIPRSFKEFFS